MKKIIYAIAGALIAPALLAAPALASTGPAVSLSITPYHIVGALGQHDITRQIVVTNLSGERVKVTTSVISISQTGTGGCSLGKAPSWATVSPAVFRLRPHGHKAALVTVRAPSGASGTWDLAAVFQGAGTAPAGSTGLSVSGAIGARLLVSLGSAKAADCTTHKPVAAAAPAKSHGIGALPIGVGGGLVLVLGGSALIAWRRQQKRSAR